MKDVKWILIDSDEIVCVQPKHTGIESIWKTHNEMTGDFYIAITYELGKIEKTYYNNQDKCNIIFRSIIDILIPGISNIDDIMKDEAE